MVSLSCVTSARDARGHGDLDEELRRVERGDGDGGARRLAGRKVLAVLLVVGGQVLNAGEIRGGGQHVVERGAGRFQDDLDAFEDVPRLLAHVLADLSGLRVPARLAGHEDELAELRGGREVRVGRGRSDGDDFLGNAGTDFASLVEAFARFEADGGRGPRPLVVPHEFVAVSMAHGYYAAGGRPAAVMVHVNVGTGNASTAIITAARANVPILMSAGRTPITEEGQTGSRDLH